MPTNYYHGLQFRWSTNGITFTGIGSSLLQNANVQNEASVVSYLNSLGNTAIDATHDKRKTLSFEIVPAAATTADGTLVTSPFVLDPGQLFTVTDTIDGSNALNGTNWICRTSSEARTVDGAAKINCTAVLFPGITS